jgi:hypothetical protein
MRVLDARMDTARAWSRSLFFVNALIDCPAAKLRSLLEMSSTSNAEWCRKQSSKKIQPSLSNPTPEKLSSLKDGRLLQTTATAMDPEEPKKSREKSNASKWERSSDCSSDRNRLFGLQFSNEQALPYSRWKEFHVVVGLEDGPEETRGVPFDWVKCCCRSSLSCAIGFVMWI